MRACLLLSSTSEGYIYFRGLHIIPYILASPSNCLGWNIFNSLNILSILYTLPTIVYCHCGPFLLSEEIYTFDFWRKVQNILSHHSGIKKILSCWCLLREMGTVASTSHLHAVFLLCSASQPADSNQHSELTGFSFWAEQQKWHGDDLLNPHFSSLPTNMKNQKLNLV